MKEIFSVFKNSRIVKAALLSLSMLLVCSGMAFAQTTIKGKVTDDKGAPITGTTIVVKGTTIGTTSGPDGHYSITIPAKSIGGGSLQFSYIGYTTQEIKFANQSVINVVMKEDSEKVDEVIVVGYGTQQKSSLTGAVSQIRGAELQKSPSTNISSMIGGRLPGVTSLQQSGQPGADQASLTIRGSSAGVTYIVDGMPRSINDIDPNDVASISVLKDASAAAVYGLNSSGGVIIITTKSGEIGKSKISYKGSYGVSLNTDVPEFLDGPGYAYWYNKAWEMDMNYKGVKPTPDQFPFKKEHVKMMLNNDPNDGWGNTNWIDETFGTGTNQQHNVTATGGTDNIKYFTSLGYLDQTGNIKNFDYKRYNLRANIDAKIAKNLTLTVGIAGQSSDKRTPGYGAGGSSSSSVATADAPWMSIPEQAFYAHPYLPKKYKGMDVASVNSYGNTINPLAAAEQSGKYKTLTTDIQTNMSLRWDLPFVKGLSLKFTGGYDHNASYSKFFSTPYDLMKEAFGTGTFAVAKDARNGTKDQLYESYLQWSRIVTQSSINYTTKINKHSISAMALFETRDYKTNKFGAKGEGFTFKQIPELDNALQPTATNSISGSSSASRQVGLVMRANYDYDSRFLAEFTGRYDGSYKFASNVKGKRWGFFPAGSVGWRISNENFFEPVRDVITNLKIRASAGLTGSDAGVNPYSFLSTMGYINDGNPVAIIGGNPVGGMMTSVIGNPNLTWEKKLNYNFGFDATLWNGLLGVEFDIFYNYTYDILGTQSGFPPSMGGYYFTSINNNRKDAKGIDLTLSHNNNVGKFNYFARFNMSWARERWLRYQDSPNIPDYQKVTGHNSRARNLMIAEGLFQSEAEIDNSPYFKGKRPMPGDIKYRDINGDGYIDEEDRVRVNGSNLPEMMLGLNLGGSWKGIDFNMLFTSGLMCDVALTGTYYNWSDDHTIYTKPFKALSNAPRYLVEDAWRPDNKNASYPRLGLETSSTNAYASTFWTRNGNYLRMKSAQIGYTLPQKWLTKLNIGEVRIFAEGSNLFTISNLPKGFDPEAPNVSNGYYPQQRTFMGGLTITF